TSGTATLETALFNVPQVVVYKGNEISYQIAKSIIKLKYISLVNLIMDELIVTELIQGDCNTNNILKEFEKVINNLERDKMLAKYDELRVKLGGGGASERVINKIIKN